jgi:hypothetical protein
MCLRGVKCCFVKERDFASFEEELLVRLPSWKDLKFGLRSEMGLLVHWLCFVSIVLYFQPVAAWLFVYLLSWVYIGFVFGREVVAEVELAGS